MRCRLSVRPVCRLVAFFWNRCSSYVVYIRHAGSFYISLWGRVLRWESDYSNMHPGSFACVWSQAILYILKTSCLPDICPVCSKQWLYLSSLARHLWCIFGGSPHTTIHYFTMVNMIAENMYGVSGLDPFFHSDTVSGIQARVHISHHETIHKWIFSWH